MRFLKNESGLALVGIVAAVVLVAAVVGVGLFVSRQQNTKQDANTSTASIEESASNSDQAQEPAKAAGKTLNSPQGGFAVTIPETWNSRSCGDYDAVAFFVPGADGTRTCVQSDAKYPEDTWHTYGRVVIGMGENAYARAEGAVSEEVNLSNGVKAQKYTYTYTISKETMQQITIHEYIVPGKKAAVTAKAFTGASMDDGRFPNISTKDLISQLEAVLGTLTN